MIWKKLAQNWQKNNGSFLKTYDLFAARLVKLVLRLNFKSCSIKFRSIGCWEIIVGERIRSALVANAYDLKRKSLCIDYSVKVILKWCLLFVRHFLLSPPCSRQHFHIWRIFRLQRLCTPGKGNFHSKQFLYPEWICIAKTQALAPSL